MDEIKFKIKGIEVSPDSLSFRQDRKEYTPGQKKQKVITDTWHRFKEMESNRNQNYRWLGKKRDGTYRNLLQYVDMSRKRWNSDGVSRTNLDEWQASVFKPETRNKIIAIVSVVAQQRPKIRFKGVEETDKLKEMLTGDLYDWTEYNDDGDEKTLYSALDAIVDGTVVRYEGYDERVRVVRDILPESDFSTGDLQFEEKTIIEKLLTTKEVKLEDFYPGNMRVRVSRMKEMPDCVWRKVMRYNDFRAEFNGWKEAIYVLPGGNLTDETFFGDLVSDAVRYENSELVEVIRYYNREADQFIILANGVWVNPIGKDVVSPLPFNHKELPFWGFVSEPFAADFFYGKSVPDKMKDEQDAVNALYNMMIDQGFISANPIILTGSPDSIDDPDLTPGKINYIGGDMNSIKEVAFSGPNASLFNLINLMSSSLEQSSVDSVQGGSASDAKTATAVQEAAQAASRIFSLFLTFMLHGYKQHGRLRAKNNMQFLTTPTTLKAYLGEKDAARFEEEYKPFSIKDAKLSNGQTGTRIIEMVPQSELYKKLAIRKNEQNQLEDQNIEKFYITPEYIRDFEVDVEVIADSSLKQTPEMERALELEFQQTVAMLYPDKANRDAMFDDFLDVFKKDRDRLKNPPQMQQPMPMPGAQGGQPMSQQVIQKAGGGSNQLGTGKPSLNQLQ